MRNNPVIIKSNRYGLVVRLDAEMPFPALLEAVAVKFKDSANFFKDATMAVSFQGRALTGEEEQALVDAITENTRIRIVCIVDERPEEEAYYLQAMRLTVENMEKQENNGDFYRGNIATGETLETQKSVVILGDVQPGANVTAKGNVVILGSCRGNVYAGAGGDRSCFVAALIMKPIQIRIADKMARSAITKRTDNMVYALDPKIAFVKEDHIYVKNLVHNTINEILEESNTNRV